MNTQNTQSRQNAEKMSIKEDWFYFLISAQQPTVLNIWLFPQVFRSHVNCVACKLD